MRQRWFLLVAVLVMAVPFLQGSGGSCFGIPGLTQSLEQSVDKINTTMQNAVDTLGTQSSQWQGTLTNLEHQLAEDSAGLEAQVVRDVNNMIDHVKLVANDTLQFTQESFNCQAQIVAMHAKVSLQNLLIGFLNKYNYQGNSSRPLEQYLPTVCTVNPNEVKVQRWVTDPTDSAQMVLSGVDFNQFQSMKPSVFIVESGSPKPVDADLVNVTTDFRVNINAPVMFQRNLFNANTTQLVVKWNGRQINPQEIPIVPAVAPVCGQQVGQPCCAGSVCVGAGLVCQLAKCVTAPVCGKAGQPCCNNTCTQGTCQGGICSIPPPESCRWKGWAGGQQTCAAGEHLAGIDWNTSRSEECWGVGGDFDEPRRNIKCCTGPAPGACQWTAWGCGAMKCPPGQIVSGVDFNATKGEQCWGVNSDFDEPNRRLYCCPPSAPAVTSGCFWLDWGCGAMQCPSRHYVASVDFNATKGEQCWGYDSDFDEPNRRIQCCPF